MDYKKILLDGLLDEIERENLPDYLLRQYKNAPEDVPPDVFFKHLKKVIKIFEEDIKRQLNRDKREWTFAVKEAQERGDKGALNVRKEALNSLDINDYSLNIGGQYLLNMNDIHFLKASIEQAYTTSVLMPIREAMNGINRKIQEKHRLKEQNTIKDATAKTTITGFDSSLEPHQIEKLYEKMQGVYFDTSLDNFKAMFKKDLSGFQPIERKKKFTNALLIYFASKLFQKENPNYVSITEHCFNARNLSQSQTNTYKYNNDSKPRGWQEIDEIIQSIYTPL